VGKVRTHRFNGHRYKIDIDQIDGYCDVGKIGESDRCISVFAKPYSRRELVVLIHETLHAEAWRKDEETVKRTAEEIGSFLWRLGYRRNDSQTDKS
jgi:hypothetical protein